MSFYMFVYLSLNPYKFPNHFVELVRADSIQTVVLCYIFLASFSFEVDSL